MRALKYTALLLPLALAMGGCDGDSTGADMGRISLLLTDAPGDVAHAWVTIDRIYLQPGEGEEDGVGNMDGTGHGRVDLMTDDVTVDLLTLANEIETLVEDVPVPVGFYHQLRVVVSQACLAVEGGPGDDLQYYASAGFDPSLVPLEDADVAAPCGGEGSGRLQMPSLAKTGIKVNLPDDGLQVTSGDQYLLLDFDVSESFGHLAGRSGMWVMHPVIRGSEVSLTASVTVHLVADEDLELPEIEEGETLSLGQFLADLSTEEADAAFTDEDEDGTFTARFKHLVVDPALDYIVTIEVPEDLEGFVFTFDPESALVTPVSGQDVEVTFTLTTIADAE